MKLGTVWRRTSAAAVATVWIAATSGVAFADGRPGVVVCLSRLTGSIRIIDSATSSCRPSEIALSLGGIGLQGPAGPTGPTGLTGAAGPAGAPGSVDPQDPQDPQDLREPPARPDPRVPTGCLANRDPRSIWSSERSG